MSSVASANCVCNISADGSARSEVHLLETMSSCLVQQLMRSSDSTDRMLGGGKIRIEKALR